MNTLTKSLFFMFIVPGFLMVGLIAYLIVTDKERIFSSIPKKYEDLIISNGDIENKYKFKGDYVAKEIDTSIYGEEYEDLLNNMHYPEEFFNDNNPNLPLIIIVTNGFFDTDITLICDHLVSWGYVVMTVKDSDPSSLHITNAIKKLTQMNNDNWYQLFYNKFDLNNFGIIGFDYAIEPIYVTLKDEPGYDKKIKTIVSLSPKFSLFRSETFSIDIPTMILIPGTGTDFSLRDQRELSDKIVGDKVIARRVNAKYKEMIYISTGYVIAWLKYVYEDDKKKDELFTELRSNELYKNCDIYVNNNFY